MRRRADDEGTILLLTCGLAVVLMALVVVVIDVSVVILAKRGVASAADGAALVAAQQPDHTALNDPRRRDVLDDFLPLDRGAVIDAVARYEREAAVTQRTLTLRADVVDGTEAVVFARRTVRLPFVSWFGVEQVVVESTGRARSPVSP
jgi:Flp pilus assembly protein TadG